MTNAPRKKYHLRTLFHDGRDGKVDCFGRAFGYVEAWHKRPHDASPYCIANEFICGEIGRFLQLPIPAFGITVSSESEYFFTSLNFNFGRTEEIPPIQPDLTWEHLPRLCTGVLLFDILVANCDRHDKNLAVDSVMEPKSLLVFDHDQALFGGGDPNLRGNPRLDAVENRLAVSNGTVTGGNRHCLLDQMNTALHVDEWLSRIHSLPEWLLNTICDTARTYGLSSDESKRAASFLNHRKLNIDLLLKSCYSEFSNVSDWSWKGALA
jgi:hypothetical protein